MNISAGQTYLLLDEKLLERELVFIAVFEYFYLLFFNYFYFILVAEIEKLKLLFLRFERGTTLVE